MVAAPNGPFGSFSPPLRAVTFRLGLRQEEIGSVRHPVAERCRLHGRACTWRGALSSASPPEHILNTPPSRLGSSCHALRHWNGKGDLSALNGACFADGVAADGWAFQPYSVQTFKPHKPEVEQLQKIPDPGPDPGPNWWIPQVLVCQLQLGSTCLRGYNYLWRQLRLPSCLDESVWPPFGHRRLRTPLVLTGQNNDCAKLRKGSLHPYSNAYESSDLIQDDDDWRHPARGFANTTPVFDWRQAPSSGFVEPGPGAAGGASG